MRKRVVTGLLALFLVLGIGSGAMAAKTVAETEDGVIVEGVYAGDINLSGLTAKEAKKAVKEYIASLENRSIKMITDTHEDVLNLKKIGITWNNPEILDEAMELGKHGNLIARFKELSDLKKNNQKYELDLTFDQKKIRKFVKNTLKAYDQEAKEPSIARVDGAFQVTPGQNGVVVSTKKTLEAINALAMTQWDSDQTTLETVVQVDKPEHATEDLEAIKDVLGEKTTTYDSSNRGRTQSLELSTRRLDGTVVWPGETISVSYLMGERSQAGGYGTGQGYFGTDVEETVGAGICQTASTLYNAALFSELDIVERYPHTLIVHYVPYGMDSTIYAGNDYKNPQKDLKLSNPYEYPVYIMSSVGGGYCTFRIYGKETRPSNRKVEYIPKTVSESVPDGITYIDDPTKPVGYVQVTQSAFPAVTATLTKVVTVDGVEQEKTLLHTDNYRGASKKAIRGTRKPAPRPTAAPTPTPKPGNGTVNPDAPSAGEAGNGGTSETQKPKPTQAPEPTKAPEPKPTKAPEPTKAPAAEAPADPAPQAEE